MKKLRPYLFILAFYFLVFIVLISLLLFRYSLANPPRLNTFDIRNYIFDENNRYHYPPLPSRFVSRYPGETAPTPVVQYSVPQVVSRPDLNNKILYSKTIYQKKWTEEDAGLFVTDISGSEHTKFISYNKGPQYRDEFRFSKDKSVLAWTRANHLEYLLLHEDSLSVRNVMAPANNVIRSFTFIPNSHRIVFISGEPFQNNPHKTVNATLTIIDTTSGASEGITLPEKSRIYYPFLAVFNDTTFAVVTEDDTKYSLTLLRKANDTFTTSVIKTFKYPLFSFDSYDQKLIFAEPWDDTAAELFLYDNTTGELTSLPNIQIGQYANIGQVAFSQSGNKIAYNFGAGDVTRNAVYDISSNKPNIIDFGSYSYALSPDEKYIVGATTFNSSQLELYDLTSNTKKILIKGEDQLVYFTTPFWYPK